jgi:tetratricopeptide (TPR) repeat protein
MKLQFTMPDVHHVAEGYGRCAGHVLLPALACACLTVLVCGCAGLHHAAGTAEGGHRVSEVRHATAAQNASAADAARLSYFYLEAQTKRWKGDYAGAFSLLRHCLEINPASPAALFDLSLCYDALRDTAGVERTLKGAAALAPDNYWYRQRLADFYVGRRDVPKAIGVYEQIYNLFPSHGSEALASLIDLYNAEGSGAKTIEALDRLEQREGKSEQISREKVLIYQSLGKEKKAYAEMQSLIREYPADIHYRLGLGNLYLDNKKPALALAVYRELQKSAPSDPALLLSLVNYYRQTGNDSLCRAQMDSLLYNPKADTDVKVALLQQYVAESERAGGDSIAMLRRFHRVMAQPMDDATLPGLCVQYMLYKHFPMDSIAPVLDRVLALEPENTDARVRLLLYEQMRKNYPEAARLCNQGTLYNPEMLAFFYYEGTSYIMLDKKTEALDAFRRGMKAVKADSDPEMVSELYAASGDILRDMGRKDEAYAMYDSCLTYKYDNAGCLNNYAYYLSLDRQRLPKAEEMSLRTVKAEPRNKTYLDTYAWVLFVEKRYTEARIYIDQVVPPDSLDSLDRDPNITGGLVEHAGDIYYMLGKRAQAMTYWLKAQQMGGASEALTRKIRLKKYVE